MPKTQKLINCHKSLDSSQSIYDMYGELSKEIHGKSWSGPSLRVYSGSMDINIFKYIQCLSSYLGFVVEEIK